MNTKELIEQQLIEKEDQEKKLLEETETKFNIFMTRNSFENIRYNL